MQFNVSIQQTLKKKKTDRTDFLNWKGTQLLNRLV